MRQIVLMVLCVAMCSFGSPIKSMIGAERGGYGSEGERPFPEGVVPVEYLESTGNQWIDTGIIADIKRIVTIDFWHELDGLNQSQTVIAGRVINNAGYWYKLSVRNVKGYNTLFSEASVLLNSFTYWGSGGRNLTIINSDCLLEVNGVKNGNPVRESRSTDDTFKLLYHPSNTLSGFVGKLYLCKIESVDGDVLCEMVPVRVDSVGAMYDLVRGELYINSGTGEFIIGPDKE